MKPTVTFNVFYGFAFLWAFILGMYYLDWSELCETLHPFLFVFVVALIVVSILLGRLFNDRFKVELIEFDPRNSRVITISILVIFAIEMIYEGNVPLLEVLFGRSYDSDVFLGFPFIHTVLCSFALFYGFYLSYLFFCTRDKKTLAEILALFSIFLILFQRQNMLVCVLGFLVVWVFVGRAKARASEHVSTKRRWQSIFVAAALLLIVLYIFGCLGNARYGIWSWNDSSMISALGMMTDKYPGWLPKEYFWTYVYLVSPLANLNANVSLLHGGNDFFLFLMQLMPSSISKFVPGSSSLTPYLPVSSLTVCSAYIDPYLAFGMTGMALYAAVQMIAVCLVTLFARETSSLYLAYLMGVSYFFLFSFFDNTFSYPITSYMLLYPVIGTLLNAGSTNINRHPIGLADV